MFALKRRVNLSERLCLSAIELDLESGAKPEVDLNGCFNAAEGPVRVLFDLALLDSDLD